ncbi:DUF2264 domain-containing protein [Microlunatus endophyticus]|uniref:DUF2264 domain-containing protein n=1 Tax=Microlunatus endophyticus TaxID=1716077 RepID=UPI00227CE416|nr:DUF2264 domain-containing protein [Microlunatus endophyticus]
MPTTTPDPSAPYTGWGRPELEAFADRTLLALRPWATPGHARFDLPGPASRAGQVSDGLEAFARSFLAAGFRLSAATEDPRDHAGWYAAGLVAGTDPTSPERWPGLPDIAQVRVEAAAIAIALHESRSWIWDRLSTDEQHKIIDWLAHSAEVSYGDNNWKWFANVTQAFLRSVGGPYDEKLINSNIELLDSWHLGDVDGRGGWYNDGAHGSIDWYNGWVMHLFALWYCRMSEGLPGIAELQERYRSRLRDYLSQAAWLFGSGSAPLYQGRSLIYRYATAGAPWAGVIFDADPWTPGTMRRLAVGCVRHFADRGAFTENGLLTMGWLGRYEPMRQPYSGPGSPYWSSLGLAGLVLGPQHPIWSTPEQPLPIESGDIREPIAPAGWLVSGTQHDGIVRVINHGVDHSASHDDQEDPLYGRLAYSTVTAPAALAPGTLADNQVVLTDAAGTSTQRRSFVNLLTSRRIAGSAWGPITCTSVAHGPIEVRIVRVSSVKDHDLDGLELQVSGFAIPERPVPGACAGLRSDVRILLGTGECGSVEHDHDNPFGSRLLINHARFGLLKPGEPYTVGISLATDDQEPAWPTVVQQGEGVEITWPDGTIDLVS